MNITVSLVNYFQTKQHAQKKHNRSKRNNVKIGMLQPVPIIVQQTRHICTDHLTSLLILHLIQSLVHALDNSTGILH